MQEAITKAYTFQSQTRAYAAEGLLDDPTEDDTARDVIRSVGNGANVAAALVGLTGVPAVALDRKLSPVSDPLATLSAIAAHFGDRPNDGVAVAVGAYPNVTVLATRCTDRGFHDFYGTHGVVRRQRELDGTVVAESDALGYGQPTWAFWAKPAAPMTVVTAVGNKAIAEASMPPPKPVRAGFGVWAVPAREDGKLLTPPSRSRQLGVGVELLADGVLVPLFSRSPDGAVLNGAALTPAELPAWLLRQFGSRWK